MGRLNYWHLTRSYLTVFTLLLLLTAHIDAVLVNVTVDDDGVDSLTGSAIVYEPLDRWNVGQNCTGCFAQPDPNRAWNYTWHDGTFKPGESPDTLNATFQFSGTALWVYCILAPGNVNPNLSADSYMTFWIDGGVVGTFHQSALSVTAYTPNYLVYHTTSMPNAAHTFMLQNGQPGGTDQTLVLLDYLIYSYDDGKPSPTTSAGTATQTAPLGGTSGKSSNTHTVAIIVPIVVVAALIALGVYAYFWRRRRHLRMEAERLQFQPPVSFTAPVPPITERPMRVISEKGSPGVVLQYSPVATDANGASGSGTNLMTPDSYVQVQAEDAGPPSYHDSVRP
ncbi:hypothetical protein EIP91_006196 [Steccherinum ochraceum]|uniref:Uncharacterized protein n=1 Tax=Steccherinum ochraceum TaxID=92696 RepID=A0A4R0RKT9_9APHY|nr:hypothetical protein EIP91_006196 [Steccherinum ochraceum]